MRNQWLPGSKKGEYSDEYLDGLRQRVPELQVLTRADLMEILEENENRKGFLPKYEDQFLGHLENGTNGLFDEANYQYTVHGPDGVPTWDPNRRVAVGE